MTYDQMTYNMVQLQLLWGAIGASLGAGIVGIAWLLRTMHNEDERDKRIARAKLASMYGKMNSVTPYPTSYTTRGRHVR